MATDTGTDTRVPFAPLGRQVAGERPRLDAAVAAVLDGDRYVLGEQVARFEADFAQALGAAHAVGVASGTDAIELTLRARGVGPGDEVVTQANTCLPTVAAIARAGATPVLCDVEPEGATIDPSSLAGAVGPRTRAVVAVHLYGQCADLDAVRSVTDAAGVALVEDCAQALGAAHGGRPAGTVGVAGCFSFYPTKNLAALGDGGAVATADAELAERLRALRSAGPAWGAHSRLDELQAAVLRARLAGFAEGQARRAWIAARYDDALAGTAVRPLRRFGGRTHANHLYVVRVDGRDGLLRDGFRAALHRRGVETLVHYDTPVHGHPPYAGLGGGPVALAESERLCQSVVSLPAHPALGDDEVERAATAAREAALEAVS